MAECYWHYLRHPICQPAPQPPYNPIVLLRHCLVLPPYPALILTDHLLYIFNLLLPTLLLLVTPFIQRWCWTSPSILLNLSRRPTNCRSSTTKIKSSTSPAPVMSRGLPPLLKPHPEPLLLKIEGCSDVVLTTGINKQLGTKSQHFVDVNVFNKYYWTQAKKRSQVFLFLPLLIIWNKPQLLTEVDHVNTFPLFHTIICTYMIPEGGGGLGGA